MYYGEVTGQKLNLVFYKEILKLGLSTPKKIVDPLIPGPLG